MKRGEMPMIKQPAIPHPGLRAKETRRRQGLTLEQISERTKLSKGYLSRFERGEKTLSVAALIRLSTTLNVSVGTLLGEEINRDEIRLVRSEETPKFTSHQANDFHSFYALSGEFEGQTHSTFIVDVQPDQPHTPAAFHEGRELLLVLEGQIRIKIGNKELSLVRGDYLEFPGNVPHTLFSPTSASRVFLVIVGANRNTKSPYEV